MWMSVIFTCTFLITWVANFSNNVSFLASFGLSIKNRKIQVQELKFSNRGQRAEARRTTILEPVEGKPHSQKDRQNEKAKDFIPDEGTR